MSFYTSFNWCSHPGVWQQVFSDLQDSFQYSSWFWYCCGLDGLNSSTDLQFPLSLQVSRTLLSILADFNSCGLDGLDSFSDLQFPLSLQVSRTLLSILANFNSCGLDGLDSSSDLQFPLSLQVSRTLLSILADFNTAVIWMVLILPLIFISSSFL